MFDSPIAHRQSHNHYQHVIRIQCWRYNNTFFLSFKDLCDICDMTDDRHTYINYYYYLLDLLLTFPTITNQIADVQQPWVDNNTVQLSKLLD